VCEATAIEDVNIAITFQTMSGTDLFSCSSRAVGEVLSVGPGTEYTDCFVQKWPLKAGSYAYHLFANKGGNITLDWVVGAGTVTVENGDYYNSGYLPASHVPGVLVEYIWRG
jgi:hypothetical protein